MRIANNLINWFGEKAILFYQHYISPYKGFCCAYGYMTGKYTCSAYGLKIVRRFGVFALIKAMPRQFKRCRMAYEQYLLEQKYKEREKERREDSRCCDSIDCCPTPSLGYCREKGADLCTLDWCGDYSSCSLPCDCPLPCDCSF